MVVDVWGVCRESVDGVWSVVGEVRQGCNNYPCTALQHRERHPALTSRSSWFLQDQLRQALALTSPLPCRSCFLEDQEALWKLMHNLSDAHGPRFVKTHVVTGVWQWYWTGGTFHRYVQHELLEEPVLSKFRGLLALAAKPSLGIHTVYVANRHSGMMKASDPYIPHVQVGGALGLGGCDALARALLLIFPVVVLPKTLEGGGMCEPSSKADTCLWCEVGGRGCNTTIGPGRAVAINPS